MDITNNAVLAIEEMQKSKLPVESFQMGEQGFDFLFSRELKKSEQDKAQEIAAKYFPANYSWHIDAPNTACTPTGGGLFQADDESTLPATSG